jgi:hypothetical protein
MALLLTGYVSPLSALAADPPPDPDSACSNERSFKSTAGVTKATLTIINNTDQPVQSLWLDYNGKRVFYEQIAAHTQYKQQTWLTHPWIVASLDGACYRLAVMTSLEQTITVNPGTGIPASTPPVVTATPIAPATPGSPPPVATPKPIVTPAAVPTAAPVVTIAPLPVPGVTPGTPPTPPDYSMPLLLGAGALAAVGAAVATYWAAHTGKLWWGTEDPAPEKPPAKVSSPEPEATPAPAPQMHYEGNFYDQYGHPVADEQVAAYEEAIRAWAAGGSVGPAPTGPVGNPDMPVNEDVARVEAERREALAHDSAQAAYIQDTQGNFYDSYGRPISKAQVSAYEKAVSAWEASGGNEPYPTLPTANPNQPVNESIAREEANRRARAANEQDPAYIYVEFKKT